MAALDPDNCIKLFKLDDSQDSQTDPETAIIPAQTNIFQAMFHPEAKEASNYSATFPDEGVGLLLEIRIELEELFHHCGDITGITDVLWEDISRRLFDRGFNVSGKQCADKWDAMYSEYVEIAKNDDDKRISSNRHFAVLEEFFKIRSNHVDSKILEDITKFLSTRFDCSLPMPKYIGNRDDLSKRNLSRDEFSNLSQEEDSHMLNDAINAAQKMLDDNLKEDLEESGSQVVPMDKEEAKVQTENEESLPFVRSDEHEFYWDTDSLQCFMDLRLYAESRSDTKRRIIRDFESITAFIINKMLLNGYQISEDDCRKKWAILLRCYNRDVRKLQESGGVKPVNSSFWVMDKVLRKYAVEGYQSFEWTDDAVRKLIAIRIPMENAFFMFKKYVILWQYVASQMEKDGFMPTYNECSIRWMELCESYQLCLETLRRRGNDIEVNWTFYHDMREGYEQNNKNTEAIIDYKCSLDDLSTENSTTFVASSSSEALADTDLEDSSYSRGSSNEKMSSNDGLETDESLANSISQEESEISEETSASDSAIREKQEDSLRVWNEETTFLLINLKLSRELKFRNKAILESDLWKEIAKDMQSAGHKVSHEDCAERWYQMKAAYEKNVASKNGDTIAPKYQEHIKLSDVSLPQKKKTSRSRNPSGINLPKFIWTDDAVETLVRLRFSEKMKDVRKYGAPIAAFMQANGYPTIAPTDVSRKWSRIISSYRRASCHYARGQPIRWQYFELVDGYMKGYPNTEESVEPRAKIPVVWTPESAIKLINTKLSIDTSLCQSDLIVASSLWEKVSAAMKAEGFPVTSYDCVAEWNLLIGSYNNTKKNLNKGNGVVIGKYFIMVDEAINKANRSKADDKTNKEKPIDFSINRKRKMDEELSTNIVKRSRIDEPNLSQNKTESSVNLSTDSTDFSINRKRKMDEEHCTNIVKRSRIDEPNLSQNKPESSVNLSTDSMKEDSPILKYVLENEHNVLNDHIHSRKENVTVFAEDKPAGKKEDMKILCDPKPPNMMIQDKVVNSTKNISTEDVNGRWSESATQLLIDLKTQYNRQFPLLPRPEIQWDKVAALLRRLGYDYTAAECSRRWDFLKTMYEQILANRSVQNWTYFDRLDAIYNKSVELRSILPKKRGREEENQLLPSPKKLIISLLPMGTYISPPVFELLNTAEVEIQTE